MTDKQAIDIFCAKVNLVLLLDHGGRAGSNFFQCLFDSHQQLVTCPLVHYVYSYWDRFFSDRVKVTKAEAHDFIARHSYFRFLYQDPIGECAEIITKIGGDIEAPFDRIRYRSLIAECFSGEGDVSRRDVILCGYAAYALCRGFDLSQAHYVMLNDAISQRGEDMLVGFSGNLIDQARSDFPTMITLALLRDPRAQYASTKHQMVNELGNNYNLHKGTVLSMFGRLWRNQISFDEGPAHLCLLYQVAAYRDLLRKWQDHPDNWLFLRNEDFNTAFVTTMQAFCTALQIVPDPEWLVCGDDYKARMMGRPWAGTGAYSNRYQTVTNGPLDNGSQQIVAVGPNRYVTERWKERLPFHEQALLESYFSYEIAYSGYNFFISMHQKTGWRKLLSSWRPWTGEIPARSWIKKAESDAVRFQRRLYFLMVWPFYILARLKMASYESQGFFSRGLKDVSVLPHFIGDRGLPARPVAVERETCQYASDVITGSLLLAALWQKMWGQSVTITVAQINPSSQMQKFISRWVKIIQCPQDLGDFRNSEGLHLFVDRENILLSLYKNYFVNFDNFCKSDQCVSKDNWQGFFSRYIVDQYGMAIARQLLIAHHVKQSPIRYKGVYFIGTPQHSFFSALLTGHAPLRFTVPINLWAQDFKHLARLVLYLSKSWLLSIRPETKSTRKKLCVQHVNGIDGNVYPGDFDWLIDSKINPAEVVYLVEDKGRIDQKTEEFCLKQKIEIVYGLGGHLNTTTKYFRSSLTKVACAVLGTLGRGHIKNAAAQAYYGVFFYLWQKFFNDMGIVCFINVADTNLDALPKMHALEALGGIDLSFEFSATGYHAFMDSRPLGRHQYICWGGLTQSMIENSAQTVPYRLRPEKIFQAGNMRTYMRGHYPEEAGLVLNAINLSHAPHKIMVMDSASTHLKLLSEASVCEFYDAIFSLMAKRPDDLFIIKPQRQLQLRNDQMAILSLLESEGRLIVAPWRGLPHYLFPAVDLAIGMPIYASSLMEALAVKCPILYFDRSGWPHVMRKALPNFCLADDVDSLIEKAEYLLSGNLSPDEECAFSILSQQIDPYGDGNGHQRFADLIRLWMEALLSTGSADQALPNVVHEYERLWPQSKLDHRRAAS